MTNRLLIVGDLGARVSVSIISDSIYLTSCEMSPGRGEARRGEADDDSEILRRIVSRTAPPRSSHLKSADFSQSSSRLHKCSATTDAKK